MDVSMQSEGLIIDRCRGLCRCCFFALRCSPKLELTRHRSGSVNLPRSRHKKKDEFLMRGHSPAAAAVVISFSEAGTAAHRRRRFPFTIPGSPVIDGTVQKRVNQNSRIDNTSLVPSPWMMWSKTVMPSNFPASVSCSVTAWSSRLGVVSPDGWL